jgi:hypothetical protein
MIRSSGVKIIQLRTGTKSLVVRKPHVFNLSGYSLDLDCGFSCVEEQGEYEVKNTELLGVELTCNPSYWGGGDGKKASSGKQHDPYHPSYVGSVNRFAVQTSLGV